MAKEKFNLENLSQLSKEKMEREEEITEKLKKLPRLSKKAIAREEEIAEKLKQLPHLKSSAGKETEEALEELRAGEKEAITKHETNTQRKSKKKAALEKEEAGWNEALEEAKKRLEEKPKNIDDKFDFSDVDAEEKQEQKKLRKELTEKKSDDKHEAKGGSEIKKHLRVNLLDYPELLQPEIKKNLQVIVKHEGIIEQNKGNAKKSAQDKIKQAKEVIERAQAAVDGYVNDLLKQYSTSQNMLMDISSTLYGEQVPGKKKSAGGLERKLLDMAGEKAGLEKNGLFGGIKNFFSDRKLKKQLGEKWDEFEVMRGEYQDKVKYYNRLLENHTKRFGRLEDVLETGTVFQMAHRGGGNRLPGIRGA